MEWRTHYRRDQQTPCAPYCVRAYFARALPSRLILKMTEPNSAERQLTAGVTCVWAGVDSAWEQEKPEARKMPENAAESHTSGARFVSPLPPSFLYSMITPFFYYWLAGRTDTASPALECLPINNASPTSSSSSGTIQKRPPRPSPACNRRGRRCPSSGSSKPIQCRPARRASRPQPKRRVPS